MIISILSKWKSISSAMNWTLGKAESNFICKTMTMSILSFTILQPWTKLVETKVESPVNSGNGSFFQILNPPSPDPIPLPHMQMLNLTKFCCQKPKNLANNIDLGREGFFCRKVDLLFYLNSFVQNCMLFLLFENTNPKFLNGIELMSVYSML